MVDPIPDVDYPPMVDRIPVMEPIPMNDAKTALYLILYIM